MARSYGINAQLLAAFETQYGTPPADGYRKLQFASYGLSSEQTLLASDLIGQGRDPAKPMLGAVKVEGEVAVPVDARAIGLWLKALLGSPVTTGTGPYTHTFASGGAVLPSLALQINRPEIPLYLTHAGVMVNELRIRFEREGLTTAQVSCVAQGETRDAAVRDATPETYAPLRFGSFHGEIRKNGDLLGGIVSAEVAYSNNLERVETIRADGRIDGADPTQAALTGTITARFSDTTLLDAATSGAPLEIAFGYVRDADTSLVFTAHEVYLPRPKLAISGPGGEQVAFGFQCAKNDAAGRMLTVVLKNDIAAY